MGHPLVNKITRHHIVTMLKTGYSYQGTADALEVGVATVNRTWREFRETGAVSQPRRKGGQKSKITPEEEADFIQMLREFPQATYDELTAIWAKRAKKRVSRSSLIRKVLALGFSLKKKSVEAKEKLTKKNASKRASFRHLRKKLPIEKLVFLDESGFQAKLSRPSARSPIGQRAVVHETIGRTKNVTLTGAIRLTGPVVMQGRTQSMTTQRFLAFLRTMLLPKLCPGDILVLDNLSAHRNKGVRRLCRIWSVRVVYLPPYSPEYNPIEKVWAWMKSRVRSRANRAMNCFRYAISGAWRKTVQLCMENLFRSCGYAESCNAI